jgi:hypothetical protein
MEVLMYTPQQVTEMAVAYLATQFGTKVGWKGRAARRYGISNAGISLMLKGRTPPPKPLLESMGLKKVSLYVEKEPT